jgi:hypothetical protein
MKPAELMQAIAQCDQPHLGRGSLEALVTRTLLMQDRYIYAAKARPDGRYSATMNSGRPAIHGLLEAGRHHLEGGLKHVPAVTGLARSQAPPIPHMGGARKCSRHTYTAV